MYQIGEHRTGLRIPTMVEQERRRAFARFTERWVRTCCALADPPLPSLSLSHPALLCKSNKNQAPNLERRGAHLKNHALPSRMYSIAPSGCLCFAPPDVQLIYIGVYIRIQSTLARVGLDTLAGLFPRSPLYDSRNHRRWRARYIRTVGKLQHRPGHARVLSSEIILNPGLFPAGCAIERVCRGIARRTPATPGIHNIYSMNLYLSHRTRRPRAR